MDMCGPPPQHPAIQCSVEVERHGRSVRLRGRIVSRDAADGAYRLAVSGTGGGGSADISQAGTFEARPETPLSVGLVTLDAPAPAVVQVRLTIDAAGQSCAAETEISDD